MKFGDSVFKYGGVGKFFEYKVVAITERPKIVFYEVECLACDHGSEKCHVLITEDLDHKCGNYRYVSMVNDSDEERQYYWHNEGLYYKDKHKCLLAEFNRRLTSAEEEVKKAEENLKYRIKARDEIKEYISSTKKKAEMKTQSEVSQ